MTPITVDLARILQTVRRPGDFHVTGRSEIFAPQIAVAGVGLISLPLLRAQAEQLAARNLLNRLEQSAPSPDPNA